MEKTAIKREVTVNCNYFTMNILELSLTSNNNTIYTISKEMKRKKIVAN